MFERTGYCVPVLDSDLFSVLFQRLVIYDLKHNAELMNCFVYFRDWRSFIDSFVLLRFTNACAPQYVMSAVSYSLNIILLKKFMQC